MSLKQQLKKELIENSDIPIKFIPRTTVYNLSLMVCVLCQVVKPSDPESLYNFLRDRIHEGKTKDIYQRLLRVRGLFNISTSDTSPGIVNDQHKHQEQIPLDQLAPGAPGAPGLKATK